MNGNEESHLNIVLSSAVQYFILCGRVEQSAAGVRIIVDVAIVVVQSNSDGIQYDTCINILSFSHKIKVNKEMSINIKCILSLFLFLQKCRSSSRQRATYTHDTGDIHTSYIDNNVDSVVVFLYSNKQKRKGKTTEKERDDTKLFL